MGDYNFVNKCLHNFALSSTLIKKFLFEIEKKIFLTNKNILNSEHIFITGLARSGTTFLLNQLHDTGEFASLQYYNLPFVTAPRISLYLKKYNFVKIKERYHNDKIFIDESSPESFDEIFLNLYDLYELQKYYPQYINLILSIKKKIDILVKIIITIKD